jgi:hypothetical protein
MSIFFFAFARRQLRSILLFVFCQIIEQAVENGKDQAAKQCPPETIDCEAWH